MNIHEILEKHWGYKSFRSLQEEIINDVISGKDTLALMPTGGGKSICFQVPALAIEGTCIVLSPLIALMNDQVEHLKKKGIPAVAIHSGLTRKECDIAFDHCIDGRYKLLYLSPERLLSDESRMRIEKMRVSLIAVDEAHCISQWGYDFRPAYLAINKIRSIFPETPVLALTATATSDVKKDILLQLNMQNARVHTKSFLRKNLCYHVLYEENKDEKILKMALKSSGSVVVYARNRRKTKMISDMLNKNGINASYYHAGMSYEDRMVAQDSWINDETRIIVATNAFGMGIDKPDVRLVIHYDLPDNLESYYQEAGRAGRDSEAAHAVQLYNQNDIKSLRDKETINYPEFEIVKTIYQQISNYLQIPHGSGMDVSYSFSLGQFCERYKQKPMQVYAVLRMLRDENYLSFNETVSEPSKLFITAGKESLYALQIQNPDIDKFIKTLLRSYEGLFDDLTRIDEKLLSMRLNLDLHIVKNKLKHLDSMGVLTYIPAHADPLLTFHRPRARKEELLLDFKTIRRLRKNFRDKANAMISYIENVDICRSAQILHYFDEHLEVDCKVCDVCRSKSNGLTQTKTIQLQRLIKHLLTNNPLSIKETIERIDSDNTEELLKIIRQLIDDEEIVLDQHQNLSLVRR